MSEFSEIIQLFKYFCVFMIGIILGRVTMAVQMIVMKPKGQDAAVPNKSDNKNPSQNQPKLSSN